MENPEEMEQSVDDPQSAKEMNSFTERLREKMRSYSMRSREQLRCSTVDALRFGLNEIKEKIEDLEDLTEKDVAGLAKRIKRRKHATDEDMYRLSHAFLQDSGNIKAFAMIPGAIQVLIKELTGKEVTRQLYAAECFCNLSLGEAPVCEKIANMAGSYMVTYLNSSETQLKFLCLWTIANVLATSTKAVKMLLQMKLLPKLWHIYTDVDQVASDDNSDCREDAGICLQLIIKNKSLLNAEDLVFIRDNLHTKNPTTSGSEYHLELIFNSDILSSEEIKEEQIIYLINFALRNIKEVGDLASTSQRLRVLYAIRVLANLLALKSNAWQLLLQQLSSVWHDNLTNLFNKLFDLREETVTVETLWLLKHVLVCDNKNNSGLEKNFMENLRVHNVNQASLTVA